MPQGKLKVKTQVPGNSKKAHKVAKQGNNKSFKKRPSSSKKNGVKKALEVALRTNIEREIRARATSAGQTMLMEKSSSKGRKI